VVHEDRPRVPLAVLAYGYFAGLPLPVADDEHVRDLAQLGVADLAPHRLRSLVELRPQ
jgi:hypothetical protein